MLFARVIGKNASYHRQSQWLPKSRCLPPITILVADFLALPTRRPWSKTLWYLPGQGPSRVQGWGRPSILLLRYSRGNGDGIRAEMGNGNRDDFFFFLIKKNNAFQSILKSVQKTNGVPVVSLPSPLSSWLRGIVSDLKSKLLLLSEL